MQRPTSRPAIRRNTNKSWSKSWKGWRPEDDGPNAMLKTSGPGCQAMDISLDMVTSHRKLVNLFVLGSKRT